MIIQHMPVIWRASPGPTLPHVEGIPAKAPFSIAMQESGRVHQPISPGQERFLDRIYQQPRTLLDARMTPEAAQDYYLSFWNYLQTCWAKHPAPPRRALDMGCGDGFLVKWLQEWGAHAVGVEPAPQPSPYGVEILPETPEPGLDLIVHHHVLEHATDPHAFLHELRDLLAPDGLMVFAVPDCNYEIAYGCLSMALHQHISYFNAGNLTRLLYECGLIAENMIHSDGSIYCCARRPTPADPKPANFKRQSPELFEEGLWRNAQRFVNRWNNAGSRPIGVYMPLRAVPYLACINQLEVPRYFDDGLAGHYLDGVPRKIEGFQDLKNDPVDVLFVMSLRWGAFIEDKIQREIERPIYVITLSDLLML